MWPPALIAERTISFGVPSFSGGIRKPKPWRFKKASATAEIEWWRSRIPPPCTSTCHRWSG